jgi:hypothetical protein
MMCNVNEDNLQMQNKRTGQQRAHCKIYGTSFLSFRLVQFIVEMYMKKKLHYKLFYSFIH